MLQQNPDVPRDLPEHTGVALLLIDVISDLEFPGGKELFPHALRAAQSIAALKDRARSQGIPAIYVNDNFGHWRADFRVMLENSVRDVLGRPIVELLRPTPGDFCVMIPKQAAPGTTTLEMLLSYLRVHTLILTGFTAYRCLRTASNRFMRDLQLFIPRDCVASYTEEENEIALALVNQLVRTSTQASTEINLAAI